MGNCHSKKRNMPLKSHVCKGRRIIVSLPTQFSENKVNWQLLCSHKNQLRAYGITSKRKKESLQERKWSLGTGYMYRKRSWKWRGSGSAHGYQIKLHINWENGSPNSWHYIKLHTDNVWQWPNRQRRGFSGLKAVSSIETAVGLHSIYAFSFMRMYSISIHGDPDVTEKKGKARDSSTSNKRKALMIEVSPLLSLCTAHDDACELHEVSWKPP